MSQLEHATAQHERCLARIAAIIADNARKLSRHDRAELVDLLVTAGFDDSDEPGSALDAIDPSTDSRAA